MVTATSSREPVVRRDWFAPGAHVNAVGASVPSARELDLDTVVACALFCDSRESLLGEAGEFRQAVEQGAIAGEDHVRASLGEVLAGLAPGRTTPHELTVFRSLGLAVEDLAAAARAVARARELGIGTEVAAVIELREIEAARARIADVALRTPLVRLHAAEVPPGTEIYLKLEALQPIGSFKIRGATNAVRTAPDEARRAGLVTASAGNMAQGVAWAGRELGLPATIAVPDHAPQAKLDAIERLGGRVVKLPYDDWWQAIVTSRVDGVEGLFVHPVQDEAVMAGNGTIGLEIIDDLPDPDAVVIPYGGGGLTVGIASAVRALRPDVRVYTAEPATGAALAAAMAAGEPVEVEYTASFVDGSGSRRVLDSMWPRVQPLVDDAFAVPIADAAAAVRILAGRARVIAEGAGALALAAALAGRAGTGKVVCIVSGGNINLGKLSEILQGGDS